MRLETYPDRDMMMLGLANIIAGQLAEFLRRDGRATLSVPGGTTPGPIFDTLSGVDLDWANVAVALNDERWVPESSDRSNTKLVRDRLIRGRAAQARLIPLYVPAETPEAALPVLEEGLRPYLPISVLVLGMGADMHTASLFPGADRLAEAMTSQALILPMRSEAAGEPRVTLTASVLKAAYNIHLLITGPEKRAALDRALHLSPLEAPVRAILDTATVHWAE